MKIFGKKFDDRKLKKIAYTAVFAGLAIWFVYRFVMVGLESKMIVFNPIRENALNGIQVDTVVAHKDGATIQVPIVVSNNRAYVSAARRSQFVAGLKIGDGEIVSVSSRIDLNTGMYIVRTRGVLDGLNMVKVPTNGFCIPAYAVRDGVVMIEQNGVAVARDVVVINQDSDIACIESGLSEGDIVIVSKIDAGAKVKIKK